MRALRLLAVLGALVLWGALAASAQAAITATTDIDATQTVALPDDTPVATFTDGTDMLLVGCNDPSTAYDATVDWGDGGGPESATVTGPTNNPGIGDPCEYSVSAGHTYQAVGDFTFTVSVTATGLGGTDPGTDQGTVHVAPAPLTAAAPGTFSVVAGQSYDGPLGSFSDANTSASAGDFTATVDWGDGTTPDAGAVVDTSTPGTFLVQGTHTYAAAGNYPVSIAVSDTDGGTTTVTATADVSPAPVVTPPQQPPPVTPPPVKPPPPTTTFRLSLGSIVRSRSRTFSVRIGCPTTEVSCRGRIDLYRVVRGKRRKLGAKIFLLAAGARATVDVFVHGREARSIARAQSVSLSATAVAFDPATSRGAVQTVATRLKKKKKR